jgi:hypothetical protein
MRTDLVEELLEAVRNRDGLQQAYNDFIKSYKVDLAERKERLIKAVRLVQEIEAALINPDADRPLFAAADRNGAVARGGQKPPDEEEPETADERQRGPTAVIKPGGPSFIETMQLIPNQPLEPAPVTPGQKRSEAARKAAATVRERKQKLERADRREVVISADGPVRQKPVEWTTEDLERELIEAVNDRNWPSEPKPWKEFKAQGCDDAKILQVIRALWPASYIYTEAKAGSIGCTIHGGPTPAFWIGARKHTDWKVAPPQLQGLQLADRVRTVLKIPRAKSHPVGPLNRDDALLAACLLSGVRAGLDAIKPSATDDQIIEVLKGWPVQRQKGGAQANAWATRSGQFWYDTDADGWPMRDVTLEGSALAAAVRRVCHIRRPKTSAADRKAVRKQSRQVGTAVSP